MIMLLIYLFLNTLNLFYIRFILYSSDELYSEITNKFIVHASPLNWKWFGLTKTLCPHNFFTRLCHRSKTFNWVADAHGMSGTNLVLEDEWETFLTKSSYNSKQCRKLKHKGTMKIVPVAIFLKEESSPG